jgi:anti-sigma factor RsiW
VAHQTKFEDFDGKPGACTVCEAMLPDAVDGALSAAEQQAFDRHVATCVECARELAEARRGAAWLGMLKGHAPIVPATLLQKILAETTGATANAPSFAPPPLRVETAQQWATPGFAPQRSGGFGSRIAAARVKLSDLFSLQAGAAIFQPRMAMTAAMAFFSLALTLNLLGVRLGDLHAASFTPGAIRRTVADASASVSRTFENNPTVYKVESRVSELRSDDEPQGPNSPSR